MSDERGQVAGVEMLPFGVLIFVSGMLLLLNAWKVIDTRMAADSAAREFVRTYVEAEDPSTAHDEAAAAAVAVLEGHGVDPTTVLLPDPSTLAPLRACEPVTAQIALEVPAVAVPFIGGLGNVTVHASHTEHVDAHRGGVPRDGSSCG